MSIGESPPEIIGQNEALLQISGDGLGLVNTSPRLTTQFSAKHGAFGAFAVHRSISGYALWTPRCALSATRRHNITQPFTRGPSRGPATGGRMNYSMFSSRCVPQLDRAFGQQMAVPGSGRSPCLRSQPPTVTQMPIPLPWLWTSIEGCGKLSCGEALWRKASDPALRLCRLCRLALRLTPTRRGGCVGAIRGAPSSRLALRLPSTSPTDIDSRRAEDHDTGAGNRYVRESNVEEQQYRIRPRQ